MENDPVKHDFWNSKLIEERWSVTKAIWQRELIRFARQRHPVWRYVIDAGCGWMNLLERVWEQEWLSEMKPVLGVGFDISQQSIIKCNKHIAESHLPLIYFVGGFNDLSIFQEFKFDVIFCWEVMYLLDDEQLDQAVAMMRSLLSYDGLLICGTLSHRSIPDLVMDGYYPRIAKKIYPQKPHWRLESEYIQLFRKHGLTVEVDRFRISPEEYAKKIKPLPPEMFWFEDDAHRYTFYTEYGKSVWICMHNTQPG